MKPIKPIFPKNLAGKRTLQANGGANPAVSCGIADLLPLRVLLCTLLACRGFASASRTPSSRPLLESLTPHVAIYHDVVNVGVIRSHDKALLIDSGEASILKAAKKLGLGSIYGSCTPITIAISVQELLF